LSEFLTGKVPNFSRKQAKKCKSVYILFEKLDIFSPGPTFGSTTPGPASALYAPGAVCVHVLLYA